MQQGTGQQGCFQKKKKKSKNPTIVIECYVSGCQAFIESQSCVIFIQRSTSRDPGEFAENISGHSSLHWNASTRFVEYENISVIQLLQDTPGKRCDMIVGCKAMRLIIAPLLLQVTDEIIKHPNEGESVENHLSENCFQDYKLLIPTKNRLLLCLKQMPNTHVVQYSFLFNVT